MVDRKEPLPTTQPDQEVATSIIERASSLSSSSDNLPPQELADDVKDGQPAPSGSTRGDKPDGISPNATTRHTANPNTTAEARNRRSTIYREARRPAPAPFLRPKPVEEERNDAERTHVTLKAWGEGREGGEALFYCKCLKSCS
jgi:hypothetical protein